MDLNMLFEKFDLFMGSPNSITKMRELILQLAVQGKLVEQDPNDEPASELLKRIKAEKMKLITEGKIKKQKHLPPITEDEIPYGIPESWIWIRLEEVFYPISVGKKKIKTSEINEEGPCPVIDQGQSYIAGYTNESDKLINIPGPVIIFGDHTCELKLINFDFVAGADGVKVLRPIEIYENYFFLVLKTLKIEERGYSRHYKYFLNNLLPLPPLTEQKRIVAKVDQLIHLCDQWDACREKASAKYQSLNDAALEKLLSSKTIDEFAEHWQFLCNNFDLIYNDPDHVNKLRQAILQLAVQGKLAPQDPNDEPASELLKRIKAEKEKLIAKGKIKKQKPLPPITEEEISYELPQGWEWSRLGQILTFEYGKGLTKQQRNEKGNIPVYGSNGIVGYHDQYLINRHCIIIGRKGSSGALNICYTDSWTTDVAYYCSPPKELDLEYIYISLKFLELERLGKGIKPGLNRNEVYLQILSIPPFAEQERIVAKVDQLMQLCDELETKLNQSKKDSEMLMQAVLQEAFGS